jgi:hypothetical protein
MSATVTAYAFLPGGLGPPELLVIFINVALLAAVVFVVVKLVAWSGGGASEERVEELERRVEE